VRRELGFSGDEKFKCPNFPLKKKRKRKKETKRSRKRKKRKRKNWMVA
jgi:hypothetical protein